MRAPGWRLARMLAPLLALASWRAATTSAGGDSLSQLAAGRLDTLAQSQSAGNTTRTSAQ